MPVLDKPGQTLRIAYREALVFDADNASDAPVMSGGAYSSAVLFDTNYYLYLT